MPTVRDSWPQSPERAAHRVLLAAARTSRLLAAAAVGCAVVIAVLPGTVPASVVLVLAGLGFLAGLPHGSIDHRVAAGLTGRPVAVVTAAYAVGAALTWVLLVVLGPVAVVAVVLLSVAHFGLGELEVVRESVDWRPGRAVSLAIAVAGSGALLLPLARAGDLLDGVATSISPVLATGLGSTPLRAALALTWVVGAVVAAAAAARAREWDAVLDVALIGALGLLLPPLLAFALWFGGWHGLRHCARLIVTEPRCAALLQQGRTREAVRALARYAALPTAAATATLAALVTLTATAPDPTEALGGALVVLLALTVPHMLVVRWLDVRAAAAPRPGASPA